MLIIYFAASIADLLAHFIHYCIKVRVIENHWGLSTIIELIRIFEVLMLDLKNK